MSSELLIRPGREDHTVIAALLEEPGPAVGRREQPISRLVVDAHHAMHRPEYAEIAQTAGLPYLIDPLTYLWQSQVRQDHAWAKLPFGQAGELAPSDLQDPIERERVAIMVADFQIEHGASAVIPAYPYVAEVGDPWFEIALDIVEITSAHLERRGLDIPLVPLFCFQLRAMATQPGLALGIDRFVEVCKEHNVAAVALCPSPVGKASDGLDKVRQLFRAMGRASDQLTRVIAWRQGGFGPALVAAGLSGYETGLGTGEQMNVSSKRNQFKARPAGGGGNDFVYVQLLGRSIRKRAARVLFDDPALGAKLMCDDLGCCPTRADTLGANRRPHVVRARFKQLRELDRPPQREWRLHQVSMEAERAATLAAQANRVLEANPPTAGKRRKHQVIGTSAFDAVAIVARELAGLD